MVVKTAQEAIENANATKTCEPGYCLKYTRTWLGIGSKYQSAYEAWQNAKHKHPGDKQPPNGAPVFWRSPSTSSTGYGHIALVRKTDMRTTDKPQSGSVDNDDGTWPRVHWGQTYLGWTEDLNGVDIPYLRGGGNWRATGDVYVSKLHKGQKDSDSVARLCYRLRNHDKMPGSHRPVKQWNNYNQDMLEAVRYWQRKINGSGDAQPAPGPTDGTSMSNQQANRLFGDNYNVIEE
jgi:hypothetical protein